MNKMEQTETLFKLIDTIDQRIQKENKESYVFKAISSGHDKVAQKFGEECIELIIDASKMNKKGFIFEAADVLFHYLLLLKAHNISFDEVLTELKSRERN
jgi:phosphoribosyl-ATP pyrophosphohydrolase/phosphoribosyl-AMP cyclohydrolase